MNTGEPDPSRMVNRRRRPGGFTLMELVVAMFITTVLVVGMGFLHIQQNAGTW